MPDYNIENSCYPDYWDGAGSDLGSLKNELRGKL
jgi:hypothetical protein